MADKIELTLHSSLEKEDWAKLCDYEHENSNSVTFQTPKGKQVKYIKADILDKITEEMAELIEWHDCPIELDNGNDAWYCEAVNSCIGIIDKYKGGGK